MTALTWDGAGTRLYENGVDHGVLYPLNPSTLAYDTGVAWNGLSTVKEKPAGAAANKSFADNILYLNLLSAETFSGEISAYTYPDEFAACDGTASPSAGVHVGQQSRQTFGMSYRSQLGSDASSSLGFKLHLVYGALASPSERDYATVNDNPSAVTFTWAFDTTPVTATGLAPTSLLVIDSTKVDATALTNLMNLLYGTSGSGPSLPLPDTVIGLFTAATIFIDLTVPTFDGAHTITIPSETGVTYYVNGVVHAAGAYAISAGQKAVVSAKPNAGYVFNTPVVTEWLFSYVS